ncbi:MAG: DNA gyrase inhibitor YacG [Rhizomicrobium sp.]
MSQPSSKARANQPLEGLCPICKKHAVAQFRPFCSRRCADLDLGQWLKGGYAIPAVEHRTPKPIIRIANCRTLIRVISPSDRVAPT